MTITRSPGLKAAALERDNRICCNCGDPAFHAHHIVPMVYGGNDVLSNLASLCVQCHGKVHGLDLSHHRELTKAGLAAAKARGVKLGGIRPNQWKANVATAAKAQARAERLRGLVVPLRQAGQTFQQIGDALAAAGHTTRNGTTLSPSSVKRLLERLERLEVG